MHLRSTLLLLLLVCTLPHRIRAACAQSTPDLTRPPNRLCEASVSLTHIAPDCTLRVHESYRYPYMTDRPTRMQILYTRDVQHVTYVVVRVNSTQIPVSIRHEAHAATFVLPTKRSPRPMTIDVAYVLSAGLVTFTNHCPLGLGRPGQQQNVMRWRAGDWMPVSTRLSVTFATRLRHAQVALLPIRGAWGPKVSFVARNVTAGMEVWAVERGGWKCMGSSNCFVADLRDGEVQGKRDDRADRGDTEPNVVLIILAVGIVVLAIGLCVAVFIVVRRRLRQVMMDDDMDDIKRMVEENRKKRAGTAAATHV